MAIVGIQGERGSACDAMAKPLLAGLSGTANFEYLLDAASVLGKLKSKVIDLGILVIESPIGTPVEETQAAFRQFGPIEVIKEHSAEVRHAILAHHLGSGPGITSVASHPIALKKHKDFLTHVFPGYAELPYADGGLAAKDLASGKLAPSTAVIAMPHAAEVFPLKVLHADLPANDNYQSRFILVKLSR